MRMSMCQILCVYRLSFRTPPLPPLSVGSFGAVASRPEVPRRPFPRQSIFLFACVAARNFFFSAPEPSWSPPRPDFYRFQCRSLFQKRFWAHVVPICRPPGMRKSRSRLHGSLICQFRAVSKKYGLGCPLGGLLGASWGGLLAEISS